MIRSFKSLESANFEVNANGAVIGAHDIAKDEGVLQVMLNALLHEHVVDTPSHVSPPRPHSIAIIEVQKE